MNGAAGARSLVKFGTPPPREKPDALETEPFHYPNLWDVQLTTGPERLIIAPATGHCELLLELARELPGPFGILYVLLLSRRDAAEPGRYQSPDLVDRATMERFVREFAPYLQGDGRHHLWVTSINDYSNLVYDNHNVIYAYGPLERYQRVLHAHGFARREVRFPVPHVHCYHDYFDAEEARILKWFEWKRFPLQPGDDG